MPQDVIDWLLRNGHQLDTTPQPTLADWQRKIASLNHTFERPVENAIRDSFLADRLGYAFFAGYQAALQRLFLLKRGMIGALCITETGGGHPKAINTQLEQHEDQWLLNGTKTFVTSAAEAETYFIAASSGINEKGHKKLHIAQINRDTPGLTLNILDALDFVPEISHGILTLDDVPVEPSQILQGDGYERYIKPFRTVEDIHVFASIIAYLLHIAFLSQWGQEIQERLILLLTSLRALADCDPAAPLTHIALGGLFHYRDDLLEMCEPLWAQTDPSIRELWQRDQKLLRVTEVVRTQRSTVAWQFYNSLAGQVS